MKRSILIVFTFSLLFFLQASATVVTLRLNDHAGNEITTDVSWHYRIGNSGSWQPIISGTDLPDLTNYNFRVTYGAAGESVNKIQDITQESDVIFATKEVTLRLEDSGNTEITTGVTWHYREGNSGSWQPITSSIELLPKTNFNFRVTYGATGESVNKIQDITQDCNVVFQTKSVTLKLEDSGNTEITTGVTWHYREGNSGSWQPITSSIELLPKTNFNFRVTYGATGESINKIQDITQDCNVVFQTKSVTLKLEDSGNTEITTGVTWHYREGNSGSWQPITSSIELLPKTNFNFRVTYGATGESVNKIQDITQYPDVVFQTIAVHVELKDCNGDPVAGATFSYREGNSGSWQPITSPVELLPKTNFNFRVTLGIAAESKIQNINNNPNVLFETSTVNIIGSGQIEYRIGNSGSWQPFSSPLEMLRLNYNFRFGGSGGNVEAINVNGCETEKTLITVKLLDSQGHGIQGALAKYHKSGWKNVGTTNSNGEASKLIDDLLGNTPFRIEYAGATNQKNQDVSVDPVVVFQTIEVTMKLLASDNTTELVSDDAKYHASGWKTFGAGQTTTTMELLPGDYPFRVYLGGKHLQKNQDVGDDPVVVFQTIEVTMKLLASDNTTELVSDDAKYHASGWKTFGAGQTTTTMELLPGEYPFRVYLGGKHLQKNQDVGDDPVVVFQTIEVTMKLLASDNTTELVSDDAKYHASGWKTFGAGQTTTTMELLPGDYPFRVYLGGKHLQKNQDVGVEPVVVFNTVLVTMKLIASDLTELTSDDAKYHASGWKTFGAGQTTTTMELLPGDYPFRVYLGGKHLQKNQDVGVNSEVVFNTVLVTMKLLDGDDNEIASDDAKYHASGWKQFGSGITTTTMEMLPAEYPFRVYLNGSHLQKNQDVGDDPVVIFTGVSVEIQYSGLIKYHSSGWKTYSFPTNLLPGNYNFRFYDAANSKHIQTNLTIGGSDYKKSAAYLRLRNSSGNGISGADSQYHQSGWQDNEPTNNHGAALSLLDGHVGGNVSFKMYYAGGSNQKSQNIAADSHVEFQTELVSMELTSSTSAPLASSYAEYHASGWKQFGSGVTPTSMELLPNTYSFKVHYAGASNQKSQDVGADQSVEFQTELVSMNLKDSGGNPLLSSYAEYHASGWKQFGTGITSTSMELLPNTYSFKVHYAGASNQKSQDVGAEQLVEFQTVLVTMDLKDSNDDPLASSNAEYHASGWKQFGTGITSTSMELLPNDYSFKVYYAGASNQKSQDVGLYPNVEFETVLVTMDLKDSNGDPLASSNAEYHASGWKQFGTGITQTSMELLPNDYSFKVYYEGASNQKNQDVGSEQLVEFQTTLMNVRLEEEFTKNPIDGGVVTYHASGWKSFGTTGDAASGEAEKELLPGTYAFKMSYDGETKQKNGVVSGLTSFLTFSWDSGILYRLAGEESKYMLESNFPNPFDQSTVIRYSLPEDGNVSLIIYDMSGKQVKVLVDGFHDSGEHQAEWNARDESGKLVPAGMYFYRFNSGSFTESKNMLRVH